MKPLRIPLIRSDDAGKYFLPLKGVNPDDIQGVEFRVKRDRDLLDVYCYSQGFDEEGNCEGRYFPIVIDDHNSQHVDDLQVLQVINPENINEDHVTESEIDRIKDVIDS